MLIKSIIIWLKQLYIKKNIKFPLTTFEDRIYVNKKNIEVF